jgi:hypothetical protein
MQVLWVAGSYGLLRLPWHFGVRRFSSVRN